MLHALLRDKLGRLVDDDEEVVDDVGAAFPRLEDPLTAIVFSRLRYLPVDLWWRVIGAAVESEPGGVWPPPPRGLGDWRFWPPLRPGEAGKNERRVEPDVIVRFDDVLLVVEAKHRTSQSGEQWREQVLAVRETFGDVSVIFLAIGGIAPGGFEYERSRAGDVPVPAQFHGATWQRLRHQVQAASSTLEGPAAWVLEDVHAAIVRWGYRRQVSMGSLVLARDAILVGSGLTHTLPSWRRWRSPPGFGSLVDVARQSTPLNTLPLSRW